TPPPPRRRAVLPDATHANPTTARRHHHTRPADPAGVTTRPRGGAVAPCGVWLPACGRVAGSFDDGVAVRERVPEVTVDTDLARGAVAELDLQIVVEIGPVGVGA